MKVSEAEKLVCPFMSNGVGTAMDVGFFETLCYTTKCMAWKETRNHKDASDYPKGQWDNCITPPSDYGMLEPQDCEGYCQRIGNE